MTRFLAALVLPTALLFTPACHTSDAGGRGKPAAEASVRPHVATDPGGVGMGTALAAKPGHQLAAFAGGCFWGVEDVFRQVPGVTATAVGYVGGHTVNPTYPEVCTHTTGHAEAVLVEYAPTEVSYEKLLEIFFKNHDPTTFHRQGPDVGSQYRSAIFTFSDGQAAAARAIIAREQARLGKPVVTEVSTIPAFYKAEEYHQQYDEKSGTHSCAVGLPPT
jgi:peptide-methionine (S)-S-oxide reductase